MMRSIYTCLSGVPWRIAVRLAALCCLLAFALPAPAQVTVTLADQPPFSTGDVPGNLALTLSVEYPTAISVANLGDYSDGSTYLGYFDPNKCYTYQYDSTTANDLSATTNSYFQATAMASGTNKHSCSGAWSGNFMNWSAMQTIDPFRWALTGGYRVVDNTTMTILEKAWGAPQGGTQNFPYRGTSQPSGHQLNTPQNPVPISSVTPFSNWSAYNSAIWSNGNMMVFSQGSGYTSGATSTSVKDLSSLTTANKSSNTSAFRVLIRVRVCDKTLGISYLESNCVPYGTITGTTNGVPIYSIYKPEGLMQQYSKKIRFAALSYLNDSGSTRQGGVLREPMGYIGPTYPQPFNATPVTNSRSEWDPTTGIMSTNPDTVTATASGVSQSGVMNYLNKFGEYGKTYEMYDNVSELYYAAIRYYENLGNVPQWTNNTTATTLDGFPAVTTWVDPIAYWCQKNFILGIGDDHTWYDYNVGGGTATGSRPKPAAVAADTFNQTATWLSNLQKLEGMTQTPWYPFDSGATYYMAGLAYGAHVLDIRPDLQGTQTISTYWMDVQEYQRTENRNMYYLAAKYGGFAVPKNYDITQTTTPLNQGWWDTTNNTIAMSNPTGTYPLPDNYFPAGNAGTMVSSLKQAFTNIANAIQSFTTSFQVATPQITVGATSFGSQYDSTSWTGTVTASTVAIDQNGNPTISTLWTTSTTLKNQLAGTGWQTNRRVATWNGSAGVPFEFGSLSSSQQSALLPSSCSSTAATCETAVVNYLRGDQTNETTSTAAGSTKSLRTRTALLGDIVDAALVTVGSPAMYYSDSSNPGYSSFVKYWASRPTMVYAAANDGMLHAFIGSTGAEQFAYVPSALFQGPSGTPLVNGLVALSDPNYLHHYYVDATPISVDVDLNNTGGNSGGSSSWATLLIGGLGKGGQSFYAINITNPLNGMINETSVAQAVKWEFGVTNDSTVGYSYGTPRAFKTKKYGWVVALTSGYDNSDGYGYLYLVNPANGHLLEKIRTPSPSNGLTQAMGFTQDVTDYTADSVYAGDLNGQLWRFDLTGTSGTYPQPTLIALLTDPSGNPQPITVAPLIQINPTNRMRYVMLGTGQLLNSQDVGSTQIQSFYAIIDGTNGTFRSYSAPVTRANLIQLPNFLNGGSIPVTSAGWFVDLHAGRVLQPAKGYYGFAAFSTLIPSVDACSPTGTGDSYIFNYATGQTAQFQTINNATVPAEYVHYGSTITDTGFYLTPNGLEVFIGTNGLPAKAPTTLSFGNTTRSLNWSELPTAE